MKKEEKDLLEVVREQAAKKEEDEARKKRENPRKPFNLQDKQTIAALALTPDEKYVIASVTEPGTGTKNTIVPNFVTESGYTEDIPSRNKVGDNQNRVRLAILNVETGEVKWVDHGQKLPPAPGTSDESRSKKNATSSCRSRCGPKTEPRPRCWPGRPITKTAGFWRWTRPPGKRAWSRTIMTTPGWTGRAGFTLGWMKSDRDLYFQSERTGYSHLYTVSFEGGEPAALTSGNWEVDAAILSKDKSRFFLTTSEGDPGQHQVYEMSADGGARTRLTSSARRPHLRPIARRSLVRRSLFLHQQAAGAVCAGSTRRRGGEEADLVAGAGFWEYPWLDAPIVTFPARDGAMLRARFYKPANFRKGGPAVIFVHGAGYLQNVHRWWSSYSHEYMFHHLLMERGYVVIDVDYRGSAGYGRDWRTGIYRHMGGKDLDDQVDAARWLVAQQGVDPKRIGIYGGSYGGFITLMAMFTQPDVFAAGAALRPVTDWAHYNHQYTANILNLPQKDAEAYKQSSPIYFAQGLKGALLICHGMVDTNVHFQDTVRLVERLIELRKENWNLAVYPVENHGFVEPVSWADEYKRILELFEKNLKSHG